MTLLRTGFFFSNATWAPPVGNAAPSISTVTLNFDFPVNGAPSGQNQLLVFEVLPADAAPSISTVTLNFDRPGNNAPVGQNQLLIFDVAA